MAGAKKKQKTAAAVGQSAASAKPQESDKSEFLKLFWPLAESERAARTLAASRILAHLKRNDAQLQYTLKRLVRGLASSRDAARQGFSAALAGLLREFEAVELRQTRELLHEAMEVHASMRGMEQREHMFGRLFGLLALHRSGRLEKDRELQVQVAKELLEMAAWKKWFREACFEAALDVISRVPSDVFVEELAATIAALLPTGDKEWNADQVLLAVGVQHYLAAQGIATSQIKDVENADVFNVVRRKHMHALAEPLRMSAGSYPRVHSAWMCVFGHILHTGTADKEVVDGELFQEAWTVLVENALLGGATTENGEITGATTHARRGIAFKLLELAAPRLPRPLLRAVLTPRLVKCLYNNSVAKKNYLHDAARHCIKAFAIHARAECVHFFAKQFVSPMPTLLETSADAEDEEEKQEQKKEQQEAIKRGGFDAIIAIEEEKERAEQRQKRLDSVRLWAIDAIIIALTESLSKESSEESTASGFNVDDALRFVVGHALFAPAGSTSASKKSKKKKSAKKSEANDLLSELGAPTPAISSTVVSYSKKRMFALLGLGLSGSADASAISKSVLARVYAISQSLLGEEVPLRKPLEDESEQLTAMSELVTSIVSTRLPSEEDASKRQQLEAFDLLLMSTSVQLLDAEQREEASVVATDLRKCFTELLESKKAAKKSSKKKKKQDEDEEESDKPDSIVVLTDMLLSLLSQDSSAMREIVNHVFRSILPLLNAASLATMVNVLAPSPEGEDEAHHDEEDEDEDMGEEEEEEEEEIVLSSAEDVSAALRSDEKLAALHREDLTLAAIVGQVKDKAQRKKDAQKLRLQHMHFQLRVLDLLQVFATSSATKDASHLVVSIVRPLIEALAAVGARDTERRVLRERLESVLLHKVLRSKDSALLGDSKEAVSVESEAFESLEAIVKMLSTRTLDKDHAGKVAAASVVYFVRVLCGSAELKAATLDKRVTRVAEILAPVVTETFTKKHARFPRSVFDELVTKLPGVSVRVLLAPLTAIAAAKDGEDGAALDEFSQGEVFRLLTLLSRPKLLPSGSKELEAFAGARATLTAAATRVVSEHAPKKANRLKLVLQFVLQLVKAWGATAEQQMAKALKPLVAALEGLESPSPAVRGIAKQALAAAAVGEPQSNPEEQEEDLMPEKKTKAKSADAKKKRKRAD